MVLTGKIGGTCCPRDVDVQRREGVRSGGLRDLYMEVGIQLKKIVLDDDYAWLSMETSNQVVFNNCLWASTPLPNCKGFAL